MRVLYLAFRYPKNLRRRSALALLLFAFVAGCATGPRGFPPVAGIANFDQVNDHLYRGAQPTRLGLQYLHQLGIGTVINLRMTNDTWSAEADEARANGLAYFNVPLSGTSRPTTEEVTQVLSMVEKSPRPVFIHCQHGCDRTGTIIACYRIVHDGWISQEALSEARLYGMSRWEFGMKRFVKHFEKAPEAKLK